MGNIDDQESVEKRRRQNAAVRVAAARELFGEDAWNERARISRDLESIRYASYRISSHSNSRSQYLQAEMAARGTVAAFGFAASLAAALFRRARPAARVAAPIFALAAAYNLPTPIGWLNPQLVEGRKLERLYCKLSQLEYQLARDERTAMWRWSVGNAELRVMLDTRRRHYDEILRAV